MGDGAKLPTSLWKMASPVVIRQAVGFVYPAYKSLQAVMTEEDQEDDLTWLRYWVVLATVHMVELVVDPLIDFFPGYLLQMRLPCLVHGSHSEQWGQPYFHTDRLSALQE